MDIGPSEAETFWTGFMRKLGRRWLRGVKLVVSDAHEGIKAAVIVERARADDVAPSVASPPRMIPVSAFKNSAPAFSSMTT